MSLSVILPFIVSLLGLLVMFFTMDVSPKVNQGAITTSISLLGHELRADFVKKTKT